MAETTIQQILDSYKEYQENGKNQKPLARRKYAKRRKRYMNTITEGKVITVMDYDQWEAEHARRKREKRAELMEDLKLTLVLTGLLVGGSLAFLLGIIQG